MGRLGNLSAYAGPCGERDKGSWGRSGHCPLRFSAHNRLYLLTMAAASYKQGIILDRLWTANILLRPKESVYTKRKSYEDSVALSWDLAHPDCTQ